MQYVVQAIKVLESLVQADTNPDFHCCLRDCQLILCVFKCCHKLKYEVWKQNLQFV